MSVDIETEIAVRAFERGFANGADALKRAARHEVDVATHAHWRRGFEAGRAAVESAVAAFRPNLTKVKP